MLPTLIAGVLLAAPAPQEVPLPSVPPPLFAVFRMEGDKLISREFVPIATEKVREVQRVVGGQQVVVREKFIEFTHRAVEKSFNAKGVQAFDTSGRPIAADRLPNLLRKDTLVVISPNGSKPDPAYLRALKDGILILVLPAPSQDPIIRVPAPK